MGNVETCIETDYFENSTLHFCLLFPRPQVALTAAPTATAALPSLGPSRGTTFARTTFYAIPVVMILRFVLYGLAPFRCSGTSRTVKL